MHTLELATALHSLGHQVCIYALDKDGLGFDRPVPCEVRLVPTTPAPGDVDGLIRQRIQEFIQGLKPSLAAERHDLYHAQDCIGANALDELRVAKRSLESANTNSRKPDNRSSPLNPSVRSNACIPKNEPWYNPGSFPIVRTVHHIEDYTSPYLQQCQDRSIRHPDRCLCVSHGWQVALQQQYGIQAARVLNGVDTHRFTPQVDGREPRLRKQLGLGAGPIYLTVGGIEPRKNSLMVLQAFAQVLTYQPQAQWVIAGGATLFDYQAYRDQFFHQVQRLGITLGDRLLLPGVIPEEDLPALYRLATAFVFPSLKEGWGLVVLEAIASGLPVITSQQMPFTEFLTTAQALWVDPNSVDAIAQAMLTVLDPAQAQSLVQNSQSVLSRYTWQTSAQQHVRHYRDLLHC